MADYTKLIINGIEADLSGDANLPLNIKKRVRNANGETAGDFTRSVLSLPATKTNKKILDGVLDFLPFRIDVNGAPKISGILQVKGAEGGFECYGCAPVSYEVALLGGNADFFKQLQGLRLADIITDFKTFDDATISAGFNADPNTEAAGFCLIKWHEWQNSKKITEQDLTGSPKKRQLDLPSYYEATPFLFIWPLVVAAFDSIGYTIESNFFNTDYFRRLIMPVPLPPKLPAEYSEDYLNFKASIAAPFITTTGGGFLDMPINTAETLPAKNPAVFNPVTFEYTVPETGFYEVELGGTFAQPELNAGSDFIAYIQVNATAYFNSSDVAVYFGDWYASTPPYPAGALRHSRVYKFNKGDVIKCKYVAFTPAVGVNSFYMKITGEAELLAGVGLDFASLVGSLEFLPMFKDLITLHNLTIESKPEVKKVIIEPADAYLNTSAYPAEISETLGGFYGYEIAQDISPKIDYSQPAEVTLADLAGVFSFEWLADDEPTQAERERLATLPIYAAEFRPANGADGGKKAEYKTEFFAKTIHVFDVLARAKETQTTPQFPLIYPVDYVADPTALVSEAEKDKTPRLLWFGGQRGGKDGFITIFENQGADIPTPAAFMVNYNDQTGLDPSLSWCTELVNGQPVAGLIERYYLHDLRRQELRHQKAVAVRSSSIDRDAFTFRRKVLINGRRFVVSEVDIINPTSSEPDKYLLLLDDYAGAETLAKVRSAIINGVFTLEA